MSANKDDILRKVHQWLAHAEEDLRLAQYGLTMPSSCPYRLIAYHSQQCAEKYLKAYLVFNGIDFPYTHNIKKLLKLCDRGWTEELKEGKELTSYAITARYPGESEEVTKEEVDRAIHIATKVRQVVRSALIQEGVELSEEAAS
ncbi:HEPN domain-containing protein [bacterium]|nr:HEPN domain-containing protein [bacterium]MBU1615833.1 HEPN domain-containing protein [bacterium]